MTVRKMKISVILTVFLLFLASCTGPELENAGSDPGTDAPVHEHSYQMSVLKEPTCTEEGTAVYRCASCGDSYEESIPAKGHDLYITELTESKCVEEGRRVSACRNCSFQMTEMLPPAYENHDYKPDFVTGSSCTTTGSITYACTRCGDSYIESISKVPHEFEEKSDTLSVCKNCGQECSYPASLGFEGVKDLYEKMRLELIETTADEDLDKADPQLGLMWEEYSTYFDSESDDRKGLILFVRAEYMSETDWRIIDHERIHPFRYVYTDGEWHIATRYLVELN